MGNIRWAVNDDDYMRLLWLYVVQHNQEPHACLQYQVYDGTTPLGISSTEWYLLTPKTATIFT